MSDPREPPDPEEYLELGCPPSMACMSDAGTRSHLLYEIALIRETLCEIAGAVLEIRQSAERQDQEAGEN